MAKELRIGLIGCGDVTHVFTAPSIRAAKNARMVIAMDPLSEVADKFEKAFEVPVTSRLEDVLENGMVDAVVVSTPHHLHAEFTIKAARAGKHVICEKPLAVTLEQADAMIRACREAGVLLAVRETGRYSPILSKARELVSQGLIGKVFGVEIRYLVHKPDDYYAAGPNALVKSDWRRSWEKAGGGPMIINICHDLTGVRFITGLEPTRVMCEFDTYCAHTEVEDTISAIYRFDNGVIGTVVATVAAHGPGSITTRFLGSSGQITIHADEETTHRVGGARYLKLAVEKDTAGFKAGCWNEIDLPKADASTLFMESFAKAAQEGTPCEVPGEEGRRVLEMILAAYQSGRMHQAVNFPLP
ncbi:MAG: Gfo/Idh/MocA family oxidoreductase [Betaproteobacteria bacterium]|nr:Gfo/Idh/MocA family oxidoreductase [Betaproteobacteria bacterium]